MLTNWAPVSRVTGASTLLLRPHDVTTTDGVTIAGTVHGHGPPCVLLQGFIGGGDLDWQALPPHPNGRFACHLPGPRSRGLSG